MGTDEPGVLMVYICMTIDDVEYWSPTAPRGYHGEHENNASKPVNGEP